MEVTIANGYHIQANHKKLDERFMGFLVNFLLILGLDEQVLRIQSKEMGNKIQPSTRRSIKDVNAIYPLL